MNLKKEFEDRVLESRESKREGGLLHHYDRLFIYADDRINILEAAIEEAIKASENSLDIGGYYNDEDVIRIDEALTFARNTLKAVVSDH